MESDSPTDLWSCTVKNLREELGRRGLSKKGTKPVLIERLEEALATESKAEEMESRSTSSQTSLVSSCSISSLRAQEAAKKAELKAKAALLEEKERLLREEMELKMRKERLQLQEEIALTEAREQALASSEEIPSDICPPQAQNPVTCGRDDSLTQREDMNAIQALLTQQKRSLLPQSQIQCFRGDPLEYKGFIRAFESRIASRTEDCAERLHFLEQYTEGRPNNIVRSYMHIDPVKGYAEAREALERKYGDNYKISKAYVEALLTWPVIRATDITGLEEFSIKLSGCLNAMEDISALTEVNHPKNLQRIVSKLPYALQEGWRRSAFTLTRKNKKPSFEDVVEFVEKEVEVATDPVFGTAEMAAASGGSGPSHVNEIEEAVPRKKPKVYMIKTSGEAANDEYCPCCKTYHDLEMCEDMLQKSVKERLELIKKGGQCFGCLKYGHNSRQCRNQKTCGKCGARHPTLLHVDPRNQPAEDKAGLRSAPTEEVCGGTKTSRTGPVMSILPVIVTGRNGRTSQTHAFLDSGSSATFISTSLAEKLKLCGEDTSLTLTTVEQDGLKVSSRAITGLEVSGPDGSGRITLPCTFTISKIPVTRSDIPDAAIVKRWRHLAGINIPAVKAEDVGLVIGCNCPLAMEPWDVVHCEDGGPYAIKTRLGWTIVGPRDQRTDGVTSGANIKINRVSASGKEDIAKMLTEMYNSDFTEKVGSEPTPSAQDKLWQKQVNDSIKMREGKYEMSLPLKHQETYLPEKRKMAEKRVDGLKRKSPAHLATNDPAPGLRILEKMETRVPANSTTDAEVDETREETGSWRCGNNRRQKCTQKHVEHWTHETCPPRRKWSRSGGGRADEDHSPEPPSQQVGSPCRRQGSIAPYEAKRGARGHVRRRGRGCKCGFRMSAATSDPSTFVTR